MNAFAYRLSAPLRAISLAVAIGTATLALQATVTPTVAHASDYKNLTWAELVPKDWDPMKLFKDRNANAVKEGSEAEMDMMREMRAIWDDAPTRKELDGTKVRIPGYVVPLDSVQGGKITQFLLVPYFGACVHSPPPPANQIVYITMKAPAVWKPMDTVWVNGTLTSKRQKSDMGVTGYAIAADVVEQYKAPGK